MNRATGFFLILALLSVFSFTAAAREVEFSWKPFDGALKYEIQVSSDEGFTKILMTSTVDKPEYSAQLGIGHYFYRVRVIDQRNKPGKWTASQSVAVSPYAPELIEPKNSFQTSYYEIQPPLEFKWKPVEGNPEYEILISKVSGQKVLEEKTSSTEFKTDKVPDGDYTWKVRAVNQKIYLSEYSDTRRFTIVKNPLTAPVLVEPAKDGMAAAYRSVKFEWTQDPHTHFTDLNLEKVKGNAGDKPFKTKIQNISGSTYTADYEEPGSFLWSVTTKEGKDTPGISSEVFPFEVRNDVIARGNYELEFSLSPASDLYATNSSLQTNGNGFVASSASSTGNFVGFSAGYYFWQSLGIFAATRTAEVGVVNFNAPQQVTDINLRLRFGAKGFNQEFIYGYRLMDLVEAESSPAAQTTDFTTSGPLIGTRITATVADNWKAQLFAYYYKPLSDVQGISNLTADVYGGVKWNFMYQFWLGYRFSFDRVNASFIQPGQGPGVNSGWTMYRTEPFYFSISFEH